MQQVDKSTTSGMKEQGEVSKRRMVAEVWSLEKAPASEGVFSFRYAASLLEGHLATYRLTLAMRWGRRVRNVPGFMRAIWCLAQDVQEEHCTAALWLWAGCRRALWPC